MTRRSAISSHHRIWNHHLWSCIVVLLIALGVLFRVVNLTQPVYWVDEVATSMRVSGYTQAEVEAQVATGEPLTISDLQKFQTIRSDRPITDSLRVLSQSPEHAPLYFVLARFWAELFGSSVSAMRSLPVVFSLLSLPAMYALCCSLFQFSNSSNSSSKGKNAIALLAISPFFVAYAQEARPYSLWVLLLLLTHLFLWRSLQLSRWQDWLAYSLSLILCLYTSLLTVLIVLGNSLAIACLQFKRYKEQKIPYLLATFTALLALSPWLWVVITRWQTLQDNTIWMQVPTTIWAILGTWFYSLAVLFFDVPVSSEPLIFLLQVIAATATLGFMGYAIYFFIRRAARPAVVLVLSASLSVPMMLLLLDLVRDGQASATPRYLMPVHIGILIALAFLISDSPNSFGDAARTERLRQRLMHPSRRWRSFIALFLSVGLLSCLIGIHKDSPYQKSRNLSNADIVEIVNQAESPQLVTTAYYIQDTISLSYQLNSDTLIYIFPDDLAEGDSSKKRLRQRLKEQLSNILSSNQPTFIFSPTEELKLASQSATLEQVFQPQPLISGGYGLTLWRAD